MNNINLKSFIRCKRKAWLDINGNKSFKTWSPHTAIQVTNQYKIFNGYCDGDLYSGLKACEKGSKGVIGLKLKISSFKNINAEIHPQILIRTIGESKWGKYKYLPGVYRIGRKTTKEHFIDLAFCSTFLEPFQESTIKKGFVISNYANTIKVEEINLNHKLRKKALDLFYNMNMSLEGLIPKITEDRKKCTICTWQNFCDKEAKDHGYLTDIDGIGSKTAKLLKNNGIHNIYKLSSQNEIELSNNLSKFNVQKSEKASKFIKQAKAYISGEPIQISKGEYLSNLLSKKDSGFFIFDIESNPDEKHDFLYGFIKIDNLFRNIEDDFYKPILNIKNNNTESYKKIMQILFSKQYWPVLHYGETEKLAIILIAQKLNFNCEEIELLKSRFIDLHCLIRESWILPIKNYSLKTVANFTGFEWTQKNVNGSKALYWWIQYRISKNEIFLKKIINYNKDDCLATLNITKWIIKNQAKKIKEKLKQ